MGFTPPVLEPPWRSGPVPVPVGCLVRLTLVWEADLEAADRRENRQVGQTTQAEQHAAGGVELTGELPKQPPVDRGGRRQTAGSETSHFSPR